VPSPDDTWPGSISQPRAWSLGILPGTFPVGSASAPLSPSSASLLVRSCPPSELPGGHAHLGRGVGPGAIPKPDS